MPQVKELLVEELQDLLHAESQLSAALPKMAEAAHHPKLRKLSKNTWCKRRHRWNGSKQVFQLLGEEAEPKPCRAMMGLIEEGQETIEEGVRRKSSPPIWR